MERQKINTILQYIQISNLNLGTNIRRYDTRNSLNTLAVKYFMFWIYFWKQYNFHFNPKSAFSVAYSGPHQHWNP
jgi:hypothetical protein